MLRAIGMARPADDETLRMPFAHELLDRGEARVVAVRGDGRQRIGDARDVSGSSQRLREVNASEPPMNCSRGSIHKSAI